MGTDAKKNILSIHEFLSSKEDDELPVESPWRLDADVEAELRKEIGVRPPGGWTKFLSLAAGNFFKASKSGFSPTKTEAEVGEMDARQVEKRLIEGFTKKLIPPKTAAGLFLVLRLHPSYGIRVSYRAQRKYGDKDVSSDDARPSDEIVERAYDYVFGVLGGTFDFLAQLNVGETYELTDFRDTFSEIVDSRQLDLDGLDVEDEKITFGLGEDKATQIEDFVIDDLIHSVLYPAGVIETSQLATFELTSDVFQDIDIAE